MLQGLLCHRHLGHCYVEVLLEWHKVPHLIIVLNEVVLLLITHAVRRQMLACHQTLLKILNHLVLVVTHRAEIHPRLIRLKLHDITILMRLMNHILYPLKICVLIDLLHRRVPLILIHQISL
jgi:hypothetical protein